MNNIAVWLTDKGKIELLPDNSLKMADNEVLIEVEYAGICGSDMHFFETGCYSKGPIPMPHILGHEVAGRIVDVGKNVTHLKVGDKVAPEPGVACGTCEICKEGRYNLCTSVRFPSVPPYHGLMRKYITHNADLCFKLPENMSTLQGALIEPFAIGLYAAKRAGVKKGDTVVILGMGCIGMMSLLAVCAMGVENIIVTDLYESRLKKASAFGTKTINVSKEDTKEVIMQYTKGRGADVVFETAGSPVTLSMSSSLLKSGGTIMMVGNVFKPITFDFWDVAHREIDIKSIYRYCNMFPSAIELLASGKVDILEMITNEYDMKDAQKAFEASVSDKEHCLKSVIKF